MKKTMSAWVIAVAVATIIAILFAIGNFQRAVEQQFKADIYARLSELSTNNAASIRSKISDQFDMMRTMATYLADEDLRGDTALSMMNKTVNSYGFLRGVITFPDGSFVTHDGRNVGNAATIEYTVEGFKGISSVTGPMTAVVDPTKTVILLTVPIYQGQQVIALLTFTYETSYLDTAFQITSFGGKGYSYIADVNGSIISKPELDGVVYAGDNILTLLQEQLQEDYPNVESAIRNMQNGTVLLNADQQAKYLSYQPLGINQWYVFSVTSKEVLDGQLNSLLGSVYLLSTLIVIILLFFILVIGFYVHSLQEKAKKELQKLAYYDSLTGIPNRHLFEKEARRILDTIPGEYAYIILNVNKFKLINEIFGFPQGDQLLLHIADTLRREARKDEVYARFDADVFHIIAAYSGKEALEARMVSVAEKISGYNFEKNVPHTLSVGFGAYVIMDKSGSVGLMGDKARMALSKIKGMHRSTTCFYNSDIINQFMAEQEIENTMQSALAHGEMQLYLQPKCSTETSQMNGAEALVRWQHPDKGIIMPDSFIPLFEKNGFIVRLDMYMVEAACKKLREWQDNNWALAPISVNQSRACLYQPNYIRELTQILKRYAIAPALIELEVTERAFFEDESKLISVIEQLHGFGFKVAMDDFGAGYSSLNMLQDVQVDVLKIDKNFFKESIHSERGKKIVSNIVAMANDLGIEVVAEGIETKEQLDFLKLIHCASVQGYYFSKPIPTEQFEHTYCGAPADYTIKGTP